MKNTAANETNVGQAIANGPNRFSRILGHGAIDGLEVRIRVRVAGFSQCVIEYTDATRESDSWHQLGANYSLTMPFVGLLASIPCVAAVCYTPAVSELVAELLAA